MTADGPDGPEHGFSILSVFIRLEEAARSAPSGEALRFSMANDLRRLIEYRLAAVVTLPEGHRAHVETVSGVAVPDRTAPMVQWLDRAAAKVATSPEARTIHTVDRAGLPEDDRAEWAEWCPPCVLWVPLSCGDQPAPAALWLARDRPWEPGEIAILTPLAGCYGHAWRALAGRRSGFARPPVRRLALVAGVAAAAALALPVSQSALAPVEIVPTRPAVVAAPIDGVIARFHVTPNQEVAAGEPLFEFDDTMLRNQALVAERTLGVAQAELRQAVQGAVLDRKRAEQVALLEAQAKVRAAELDYARSLLERLAVKAERPGIAVFTDANDWIGRPVVTGQRILLVADPARVEARVALSAHDAIALAPGARIDLFLDNDPLDVVPARLVAASFEAELTPAGVMAFRLTAALEPDRPPPRIGLQGTANVQGRTVPLLLYLFRRPLTGLRQWLGF